MKSISVLLLYAAAGNASILNIRAPPTPTAAQLLGFLGLDINNLGGLDLAKYAPILKPFMPMANAFADSGALLKYVHTFAPTLKLEKTVPMEPVLRPTAKKAKIRLGPYTLEGKGKPKPDPSSGQGYALAPDGQSFIHLIESKSLCTNCTLLSSLTSLEFEDGSQADPAHGVFLHHISAADISRSGAWTVLPCDYERWDFAKQPVSPTVPFVTFTGGGEDNRYGPLLYTTLDGKYDSGFHLLPKSELLVQMEVVNYNEDSKTIYTTVEYEYIDGIHGQSVIPNLIPVTGCRIASPNINMTGPAETVSKEFAVLVDGTIVAMKGHLHTGGVKMILNLNGEEICTSYAKYDKNGIISGMSPCDRNIKVKRGDFMSMVSVYDVKQHPMRSSAHGGGSSHDNSGGHDLMGMMSMSIALDK